MQQVQHGQQAPTPKRRRRRGAHILSTLLFLTAIAFAGIAVWIYLDEERDQEPDRVPPQVTPGLNDLLSVRTALEGAGLDATIGRGTTALTDQLQRPGQLIEVADQDLYVFIYNDPDTSVEDRQAASDALDPASLTLETRSGQPIAEGQPLRVSSGSNVIAVLAGGDDELAANVQQAIEGLS